MFALESLAIAGENYQNSKRVQNACHFLIGKMKDDGGWGETYMVSQVHPHGNRTEDSHA